MSALLDALGWGLGQAANILDKPGAAVRGLLAGRPDQLMHLLPGSDLLGLTRPEDKVSGRDLLRQYGLAGEDDTWGNFLGGMAVDTLTNPLTYVGGGAAKGLLGAGKGAPQQMARVSTGAGSGAGEAAAGSSAGRIGSLLGKRRGFDVLEVDPHANEITKVTGRAARPSDWQSLAGDLIERAPEGTVGLYDSTKNTAGFLTGADNVTRRHEIIHGLVDQAIKQGNTQGLPLLAKPAVWTAPRATGEAQPFRTALSAMFDEMAAQTLENKGLWNQAKGFGNYMFQNPFDKASRANRQAYQQMFDEASPAVGALFRTVGYTPHIAAGAGLAGAGAYGLSALNQ